MMKTTRKWNQWVTAGVTSLGLLLSSNAAMAQDEPIEAREELRELRKESLETRRQLQSSVLISGLASVAIGVGLAIPDDYDQGLRYAGLNTIAFGVVNTIVGGIALHGIAEESDWEASAGAGVDFETYREHALADESREAWGHGINLGLAAAYGAIGGMALVVSQLNVDHPNRWLGSGVAITAQAAHLLVVDLVGTMTAREYEERMRLLTPAIAYDPSTSGAFAGATFRSDF